jgi:ABC-type bacteriocin/lantibiotic exporter with double-glycine peptidase domain
MEGLLRAAREKGLQAEALQVDAQYLRHWRPKGIAWVQGDHYVAFLPGPSPEELWVHDPGAPGPQRMKVDELIEESHGVVLLAAWGRDRLPPLERETR